MQLDKKRTITKNELLQEIPKSNLNRYVIDKPLIATMDTPIPTPLYYGRFDGSTNDLLNAFKSLTFPRGRRVSGMQQSSIYTNTHPRNGIRENFCGCSAFSRNYPSQQAVVDLYAKQLDEVFAKELSDYHEQQLLRVTEIGEDYIRPEYLIGETSFTSGVINKNCSLQFHRDSSNLTGALSAMIVLKGGGATGGNLILPEYDLEFKMNDGNILIFDGGQIAHGVTPIKEKNGYRYSLVFYTQSGARKCLSPKEELNRIQNLRLQKTNV